MLSIKVIALFSSLLCATHAYDVYATFYDDDGNQVGGVNYDVGNPNCFGNSGSKVSFSQGIDGTQNGFVDGPYCLSAYTASDCSGVAVGHQEFNHDYTNTKFGLPSDVVSGYYRSWHTNKC